MSDLEELQAIFTKFGIQFTASECKPQYIRDKIIDCSAVLIIGCGVGYAGCEAEFYFDKDGKFMVHGVWE